MSIDLAFKISVFGDSGVGKTSLINRFITDKFDLNVEKTMGVNISTKRIEIKDLKVVLQIWDFVGEERFRTLIKNYARGTFGGIFMYDITNKTSFLNLTEWVSLFHILVPVTEEQIPLLLVGGKSDLYKQRVINREEALEFFKLHNMSNFFECSSKTGENIEKVFFSLANEIMKKFGFI